jgi:hypothetical protein
MTLSEYLEKQAEAVQSLWQSSAEEHADWKKYLLRYQHESLRWLVAIAVAVLGVSQFSSSLASSTPWHLWGRIILVAFVVGSIAFDKWRSERTWKKQVTENDFTNQKLGELRIKVGEWQENEVAQKTIPDASAIHHHINAEIIAWHGGRTPSHLEKIGDWFEGKLEVVALLCFVVGVAIYFLP